MIFMDNAAGSWPKPFSVGRAMSRALDKYGANPGRGSYALTRETAAMVEIVRAQVARLILAPDPSRVVFTPGATYSLNIAIRGLLRAGDHAICSSMEHNAVFRPLAAAADAGLIELTIAPCDEWGYLSGETLAGLLRPNTRLVAFSQVSNVSGSVQPAAELCRVARDSGALTLVDGAQSAGLIPIDVEEMGCDLLALAGHKALYGPAGVGALWVRPGVELRPLVYGGTGSHSELRSQPEAYPDRLEAGSLPTMSIAGWGAALDQVELITIPELAAHAQTLTARLESQLREIPGLSLQVQDGETRGRGPLLSLTIGKKESADVAALLDERGLSVRAGYHCAPLAHRTLGTWETGSLRLSPGWYNSKADVDRAALIIKQVAKTL